MSFLRLDLHWDYYDSEHVKHNLVLPKSIVDLLRSRYRDAYNSEVIDIWQQH